MSKSKRIKGRKSDPEQTAKAWHERKKAEREAAKAGRKAPAGKGRR